MTDERKELIASILVENERLLEMLLQGQCDELSLWLNKHGFFCTYKEVYELHDWICNISKDFSISNKELSDMVLDEIIGGNGTYTCKLIRKVISL